MNANKTSYAHFSNEFTLWELNESLVCKRIPAIIFVGFLALVGSVGNGTVMYVYRGHMHRSTANVFIFWLSVFDFSLCFFEMPYKAFEIRFPYMYGYPAMCKGFMFVEIFLSMVSVVLLLCIAFDRYFVVRKPLQRLTMDNINKIIFMCVGLGLLFSWPTIFIYGQSIQETPFQGINGWGCGISKDMLKSKLVSYWYYFLYVMFVGPWIILITLYVRIWISIRKWKYTTIGESMSSPHNKLSITMSSVGTKTTSLPAMKYKTSITDTNTKQKAANEAASDPGSGSTSTSTTEPSRRDSSDVGTSAFSMTHIESHHSKTVKHARMRRNTLIFGAIALLFVLSYLPILVIIFLRTAKVYNISNAPLWQAQIFEVLHRSGYINNALNPYIYAFLSPWFRRQVKQILSR